MAFAFTPNNANSLSVSYGIDHLFDGYIVQDETLTENVDKVTIPDQKGKTAQVWGIQRYWNASFTLVGPINTVPTHAGATYEWYRPGDENKYNYFVNTCELRSTYNDSAKWSVQMECYQNATYKDETGLSA